MQKKLLFLSFIEGAAVMAAELCGAKLLAPLFGSSLYVWASVMGITLMALAGGYFYGGWSSGKKGQRKSLYRILFLASLLIALMLPITRYLLPFISGFSFMWAVLTGTFLLLFPQIFLLGAASPLFIAIQTTGADSGRVSGVVYAVSTLGGIVATFLCGFFMIPAFGLGITLLCFASLLFISTLIVFGTGKFMQSIIFLGIVFGNLQFIVKNKSDLWSTDGMLGKLQVQDVVREGKRVRILKINNIVQTEMFDISRKSASEYVQMIDNCTWEVEKGKKALVLGLGGGLTSNLLVKKNYDVTGVEFDNRIIEAAKNFFFLDSNVKTVCADARYYLNHCTEKFDLVLFDVFKAEEQPDHVLTVESLERLKQNLSEDATILVNWHGYLKGIRGRGTSVLRNTLMAAGFKPMVSTFSEDENGRNLLFILHNGFVKVFSKDERGNTAEYSDPFSSQYFPTKEVNTDDKPLLEKYNAEANKSWRSAYLNYYRGLE